MCNFALFDTSEYQWIVLEIVACVRRFWVHLCSSPSATQFTEWHRKLTITVKLWIAVRLNAKLYFCRHCTWLGGSNDPNQYSTISIENGEVTVTNNTFKTRVASFIMRVTRLMYFQSTNDHHDTDFYTTVGDAVPLRWKSSTGLNSHINPAHFTQIEMYDFFIGGLHFTIVPWFTAEWIDTIYAPTPWQNV